MLGSRNNRIIWFSLILDVLSSYKNLIISLQKVNKILFLFFIFFIENNNCIYAQENDSITADGFYNKAENYANQSLYDKALNNHLKAVRLYEKNNNHYGLSKSYIAMGLLYTKLKDYSKSRNYYNKSLNELEIKPNKLLKAYTFNNIGISLENQNKLDSANYYYKLSLKFKTELDDSLGISKSINNIGGIYLKKNQYKQALNYHFKSLVIKKAIFDTLGLISTYSNIANVYGWLNKLDSTNYYLTKGHKYLPYCKDKNLYVLYYKNFSALHVGKENYEKAYYYLDSSITIQKEIFNTELAESIANYQIGYETEKKDAEIKSQQLKNTLLEEVQKKQKKQKWIYFSLCIILSLLLILFYFLIKNKSERIKQQQLIHDNEMRLSKINIQQAEQQEIYLKRELEIKSNELLSSSTITLQKQDIINQLKHQFENFKDNNIEVSSDLAKVLSSTFTQNVNLDQEWKTFKIHFEQVHSSFFKDLLLNHPNLTEIDLRHCAYIKIGLVTKEIATLLNVNPTSVQKSRVRLKKKLNLSKEQDLYNFIKN